MNFFLNNILPGAEVPIPIIESALKDQAMHIVVGGFTSDEDERNLKTKFQTLIQKHHATLAKPIICNLIHFSTINLAPEVRSIKSLAKSVLLHIEKSSDKLLRISLSISLLVTAVLVHFFARTDPRPMVVWAVIIVKTAVCIISAVEISKFANQCIKAFKDALEIAQKGQILLAHVQYLPTPGPLYNELLNERTPEGLCLEPITGQPIPLKDFYSPRLIEIEGYALYITSLTQVFKRLNGPQGPLLKFEPTGKVLDSEETLVLVAYLSTYFCDKAENILNKFNFLELEIQAQSAPAA